MRRFGIAGLSTRLVARLIAAALVATVLAAVPRSPSASGPIARPAVSAAVPIQPPPGSAAVPEQEAGWQGVSLEGATCGRGAPFRYFFDEGPSPGHGIVFLLNGGGACIKDGLPPPGSQGIARQLYCMAYSNFVDVLANESALRQLPDYVELMRRDDPTNPFRNYTFVFVPYCTGDVAAGAMTEPYDYDPDPEQRFDVVHRGHLNVLAVIEDAYRRWPADAPVVLTGVSAGGFGAILNFPAFVARWPQTALIPDAGIAPPHPDSLMWREGARIAERWAAGSVLPPYCADPSCLADTLRLLKAHAAHYDGRAAPWHPFGLLQGQQDGVLSEYLEMSACSYELGLRRGLADLPPNARAYVPATAQHVFSTTPGYETPVGGVALRTWLPAVARAHSAEQLPPSAVDPWLACNALALPALYPGLGSAP